MTPYFKAIITFMVLFSIIGIMFGGLDTRVSSAITVVVSLLAAVIVWFVASQLEE